MHLDPGMLQRVSSRTNYQKPSLRKHSSRVPLYAEVQPWQRRMKRALDVVISVVALAGFGVLFPLIAIAIKLDSPGGIFYRQTRVGINRRSQDRRRGSSAHLDFDRRSSAQEAERRRLVAEGRPFEIIKLRTMYENSESDGIRWAAPGDPRVTRVGQWLRLSRLDEFPQFWNVLRGDMSVVGPRPERPPFITLLSEEVPGYLDRLRFKPGITGLAQVELGYDTDFDGVHRKVDFDLEYILEFSLRRDFVILLRTVKVVVTGRGAF